MKRGNGGGGSTDGEERQQVRRDGYYSTLSVHLITACRLFQLIVGDLQPRMLELVSMS